MTHRNRLSRSRDFDTVYRQGRSVSARYLVLYSFVRTEGATEAGAAARLGLAVSRRIGGAVERNRIKRCLREAFAVLEASVPPGRDYVLVGRPGLAEAAAAQGFEWLVGQVRDVFERAAAGGTRP
jgi:ribonuclease P protein component